MANNFTYTLVPENQRNVICSHYGTPQQIANWPVVGGYIVIDLGEHIDDMEGKHNAIWNVCSNHSYSSEILDVLKGPLAHDIAHPLAGADANAAVPPIEDATQEEYAIYRANWDAAYSAAYTGHYDTAFASVTADPVKLAHAQAKAFVSAYQPVLEV